MPYKLSATLLAHSSDVRAVASPTNELVLSASRDSTAISWQRPSPTDIFQPSQVIRPGNRYVNAVAYLRPSPTAPQGYILTAGQETVINAFPLGSSSGEPEYSLVGHEDNVCALDVSASGAIMSGSWDKTAKVWINFKLAHTLKGHEQAVWAVQIVTDDQFLTASADKTIKLWDQHKIMRSFDGHTDAVRGLALIPDIGFVSCANDSEIRVWTLDGDCVHTLSGHTSYVYSLSVLPNGDIVSGGEDRSVRVWRGDGACAQTIVHPAISVWTVSTMPNGDIVSGCSDGAVRVFSASEERWASSEDIKTYEDTVAKQTLPSQVVGDLKKSDMPGIEALDTPGKKDGETKIVKRNDVLEAHQWDGTTGSWKQMGEVVDAVGEGRKQLDSKTGKEYDYIFDVDIKDGAPPLKLPYNVSENPYMAAQRFLEANELPNSYLDQVVKFIEQNTAGVTLGASGNEYVDPYTGASRYQSKADSVPTAGTSQYQDPYTGASRYQSNTNSVPTGGSSQYRDPYTGASSYSTQPAPSPGKVIPAVLPVTKYLSFKQGNVTAMQGKIHQFQDQLRHEISTASLAMYPDETRAFDAICEHLQQVAEGPSMPSASPAVTVDHVESIISVLDRWPMSQRFPVFDLSRLVFGFCPEPFATPGLRGKFLDVLFKTSEWTAAWSQPLSKPQETVLLLLLRGLANAFQDPGLLDDGASVQKVFAALDEIRYDSLTKFQRVALASVLFNYSCIGLLQAADQKIRTQHVTLLLRILQSEKTEAEVIYRALVGLGNIAYSAKEHGSALDADQTGMAKILVQSLSFTDDRILGVVREIGELL